ncbi:MAG: autotransporter domain-containing protein [Candidatus Omnitrophica bacterium]|nr:autotransporter domain-containing protein [Candidatus Omnitrophota bacterium]
MKRTKKMVSVILAVAVMVTWCIPSFAAVQDVVSGGAAPGVNINASGILDGVHMDTDDLGAGANTFLNITAGSNIYTANSAGGNVTNSLLSAAYADDASFAYFTFAGDSKVFGTIGVGAIIMQMDLIGGVGTTVDFYGRVLNTTLNVDAGTVNYRSGVITDAVTNTNFTGDGTINVYANTRVTGDISMLGGTANQGTLNLMGAAAGSDQWTGSMGTAFALKSIQVDGGSTAGVTSQITGAVHTYEFDLGTNTLNLRGAFANELISAAGNGINTTLASATVYGNIDAVGAFTYTGDPIVNVTIPTGTFIPVGTIFTIVDNNGAGATGQTVTVALAGGTNPLYTFTATPTNVGNIQLELSKIPLQASDDPVVDTIIDAANDPDMNEVVIAINNMTDPNVVKSAVAQLDPSSSSRATPQATFQGTRQFQNLWVSRLDACSIIDRNSSGYQSGMTGISTGDIMEGSGTAEDIGIWAKGFGYFGEQGNRGSFDGYDIQTLGAVLAADTPLGPDTRIGVGFGYSQSEIDGKKSDANTDFDTYQATVYLRHQIEDWYMNASGSFGWNEYEGNRYISFTGVNRLAKADYNGQEYAAYVDTGYNFHINEFTITPVISMRYSHVNIGAYTETGAGALNLKVDSQSYDFLESGVGGKVAYDFKHNDQLYVPEIHGKWFHELMNPKMKQTTTFTAEGAGAITTEGVKSSDDTYNVGAGLSFTPFACSSVAFSIEAVYDYYWTTEEYAAHQGTLRATIRF